MTSDSQIEKSEKPEKPEKTGEPNSGGWSVYKSGQGYWTRMCTAGAVAILAGLICYWIYSDVLPAAFININGKGIRLGITVGIYIVATLFFWRYMNRPNVADFLIDTELEMAKVNWTSAKELFGSTRIVIFFVVLISFMLAVFDFAFIKFFVLIGILTV